MSHFAVLVITSKRPTEDVLEEVLLPYHEYECTGIEKYVVDVDVTDETLVDFETYGKPEGKTYDDAWVKSWNGAEPKLIDGEKRYFNRTNPNAHWDWYVLGGRWKGMLKAKANDEVLVGQPGVFKNESYFENGVDSCQMQALDLKGMQDEAEKFAAERFDKFHGVLAGRTVKTWKQVLGECGGDIEAARVKYQAQPVLEELHEAEAINFFDGPEPFLVPRDQYLTDARKNAFVMFAVVKDGKWYECGKMGWWGVVADEKDKDVWTEEFNKLLEGLSPTTWISVVDCHI